jgi:hypothetical protein
MRVFRKAGIIGMLAVVLLFSQIADATMLEYLPDSTFDGGNYMGYTYYNEPWGDNQLYGRIDYAVYDTASGSLSGDEITFLDALGLPGRYVYAYQIFNDHIDSEEAVAYFSVFALDGNPLEAYEESIDSFVDPGSGVEADSEGFTESNMKAYWEFDIHLIHADEHSWYLAFGSDAPPVVGDFEIKGPGGTDFWVSDEEIPEPAMITLFGFGSVLLMRSRRKTIG